MPAGTIHFFVEETDFKPKRKNSIRHWILTIAYSEGFKIKELSFIFCSDTALLEINQNFLKHDTFTDIITFDYSEKKYKIIGEIYISVERVKENALLFKTSFDHEMLRVIIHGVFHLCGYKDTNDEDKILMRNKESEAIALFNSSNN